MNATRLRDELATFEGWLVDHNFDVDPSAFRDATYDLLRLAFPRVPQIPLGMLAYEAAAASIGRGLVSGAIYSRLPGARELRHVAGCGEAA